MLVRSPTRTWSRSTGQKERPDTYTYYKDVPELIAHIADTSQNSVGVSHRSAQQPTDETVEDHSGIAAFFRNSQGSEGPGGDGDSVPPDLRSSASTLEEFRLSVSDAEAAHILSTAPLCSLCGDFCSGCADLPDVAICHCADAPLCSLCGAVAAAAADLPDGDLGDFEAFEAFEGQPAQPELTQVASGASSGGGGPEAQGQDLRGLQEEAQEQDLRGLQQDLRDLLASWPDAQSLADTV